MLLKYNMMYINYHLKKLIIKMKQNQIIIKMKQNQIIFENTYLDLSGGEYSKYPLGSVGNIIHYTKALGLMDYDNTTIGEGEVRLYGNIIATYIIDKELNMPIFTFIEKYKLLQERQDIYISMLKTDFAIQFIKDTNILHEQLETIFNLK